MGRRPEIEGVALASTFEAVEGILAEVGGEAATSPDISPGSRMIW